MKIRRKDETSGTHRQTSCCPRQSGVAVSSVHRNGSQSSVWSLLRLRYREYIPLLLRLPLSSGRRPGSVVDGVHERENIRIALNAMKPIRGEVEGIAG